MSKRKGILGQVLELVPVLVSPRKPPTYAYVADRPPIAVLDLWRQILPEGPILRRLRGILRGQKTVGSLHLAPGFQSYTSASVHLSVNEV